MPPLARPGSPGASLVRANIPSGVIAQSVEHRTFNPLVVGSIPTHPTSFESAVMSAARRIRASSGACDSLQHLAGEDLTKHIGPLNCNRQ